MLIYLFVFAFRFELLKSAAVLVRFSPMKSWERLALDVSETYAKHDLSETFAKHDVSETLAKHDVSETLAKRSVPQTFANARHAGLVYGVTDTDCWAQNGSAHYRFVAILQRRFYLIDVFYRNKQDQ